MTKKKAVGPSAMNGAAALKPTVQVLIKTDPQQGLYIHVSVRSKIRPASIMYAVIPQSDWQTKEQLRKKVTILAGALAEQIADRLGDGIIDPDTCAIEAEKLWDELLRQPKALINQ